MDGKLDWLAAGLPAEGTRADSRVGEHIGDDVPTSGPDEPMGEVRERLAGTDWEVCVVVNSEGVVMGLLGKSELSETEGSAEQAMRPGPNTFRPHVDVGALAHHMAKHDLSIALITTSDGKLLGALSREMALEAAHGGPDHEHHHEGEQ